MEVGHIHLSLGAHGSYFTSGCAGIPQFHALHHVMRYYASTSMSQTELCGFKLLVFALPIRTLSLLAFTCVSRTSHITSPSAQHSHYTLKPATLLSAFGCTSHERHTTTSRGRLRR